MVDKLLQLYNEEFRKIEMQEDLLKWAQRKFGENKEEVLQPTIPFVGEFYGNSKAKVLIYASAENLSNYSQVGWIENDGADIQNRHRWYFERDCSYINDAYKYPDVHCRPMQDGSLMLASAYICKKIGIDMDYATPRKFIDQCAFGNYGKFSIDTGGGANIDYAGDDKLLSVSNNYIKHDLEILQPDYVIMPKTIYWKKTVQKLFNEHEVKPKVIPIYQMNKQVINFHVKPKHEKRKIEELDNEFQKWYKNIAWGGKSKENYLSVFNYLDKKISEL